MSITILVDNVTGDSTSNWFTINNFSNLEYGLVQSKGTGIFTIQGRMSSNMDAIDIAELTNTAATRVSLMPEMRIASASTIGTYRIELGT